MTVTFSVYQAGSGLDDELARLCSQAIHGRTDRRPVTADLVASRLAAGAGQPVTLLAAVRDPDRRLIAAAALRWPYVRTGIGRLWGPVVHPHHQGHRLGESCENRGDDCPSSTHRRRLDCQVDCKRPPVGW
jgi:hypothetical protein